MSNKENKANELHRQQVTQQLRQAEAESIQATMERLGASYDGLTETQAESSIDEHGRNEINHGNQQGVWHKVLAAFTDPFSLILLALAIVSLVTDVIMAEPGQRNYATVTVIATMIVLSGGLRLFQQGRSDRSAAALAAMIKTTTCVQRQPDGQKEIPLDQLAVGDIVLLAAGDIVPADLRIFECRDLFVNQAALSGESVPLEKGTGPSHPAELTDCLDLAFMGTTVASGTARGVVVGVGGETLLGTMATSLEAAPTKTGFDKGIAGVSRVLVTFMLVMAPIVFLANGLSKGDWLQAGLFSIAMAVGLTPEMLPMLVTTCMVKGAVAMGRRKVILKHIAAVQNLGSMDVLCTDKTGTLTQDQVVLQCHLDIHGHENMDVLRQAVINSYHQTGLRNLMDRSILSYAGSNPSGRRLLSEVGADYTKVDEIPFDFDRRRMSVVVADRQGHGQLVTKGAVEEMLSICDYAQDGDQVVGLDDQRRDRLRRQARRLNDKGMRVILVARKDSPAVAGSLTANDERGMIMMGCLGFLDPPKDSARQAISQLNEYGVGVRVLTGDNVAVTQTICGLVGLKADRVMTGQQVAAIDDTELARQAESVEVFAKLNPQDKARIVAALRHNGHTVGYMGDGVNDAAAMRAADVGISVDTAVDVAKESAGVILLEKDLKVLGDGVIEGRRTYANMIKYIKLTASSNFGNALSVLLASLFLPFLPMRPLQMLMLNLAYDITCIALPWDNVDADVTKAPARWDAGSIIRFMLWMGPVSSLFDLATFALLFMVVGPTAMGGAYATLGAAGQAMFVALFQTGWFLESICSQTLVIHVLRTAHLPLVASRASWQVTVLSSAGILLMAMLPYSPIAKTLGLTPLPHSYYSYLAAVMAAYLLVACLVKSLYIHRYRQWL